MSSMHPKIAPQRAPKDVQLLISPRTDYNLLINLLSSRNCSRGEDALHCQPALLHALQGCFLFVS